MTTYDISVRLKAARELLAAGEPAAAEQYCLQTLGLQAEHPDALNLLGLARSKMGDHDIADKAMVRAINAAPDRAEFYLNLGNLRRARGNLPQAAQLYAFAIDRDSAAYEPRLYLGETLKEMGMADKAIEYLVPLSVARAREPRVWRAYAEALQAAGRHDDALKAYDRALQINPEYVVARHNKAALLNTLGRHEDALAELDRAEASGLKEASGHINRAHALLGLGRLEAAVDEFTFALARNPENCQAHRELAELLWMMGRGALVERTIATARAQRPESHQLALTHAMILKLMQRYDEAEALLRDNFPDMTVFPRAQGALASVLNARKKWADAEAEATAASAKLPMDDAAHDALCQAQFAQGAYDKALLTAERCLAHLPDNQMWMAYKATALRLLGRGEYHELYDYDRFVRAYDLPVPQGWGSLRDFLSDLRAAISPLHLFAQHPLNQSLRHGSQTTRDLSKAPQPILKAFYKALDEPIRAYMADLGRTGGPLARRNTGAYRFNGAWSIRLQPGGFHVNHVHPKGWLSSSFYLEVPETALDTPEREGWIAFGAAGIHTPDPCPAEHYVRPRAGRLVLFPSYMWHGTIPFHHGSSRTTMPFDVVPA